MTFYNPSIVSSLFNQSSKIVRFGKLKRNVKRFTLVVNRVYDMFDLIDFKSLLLGQGVLLILFFQTLFIDS